MSITTKGIKWGYGVQASARGTAVAAATGLRVRDEGGVSMFKPNRTHVAAPIKAGEWGERDYEEYVGIKRPGWSHPGLLSIAWLQVLLAQVMDVAAPDGSGNIVCTPLASGCAPAATKYLSIIRRNALATAKDHRLTGAVAKSIKFSASEADNKVKLDTEFVANDVSYAYTGSSDTYTLPSDSFLLHKNMTFKIGSTATQCPEYDLTIDFQTTGIVDNAAAPQEEILGKLLVTGNVRIPWADDDVIADFEASVANTLKFSWGATGVSGWLEIVVPVKYTEPDEDTDNDVRLRQGMPFKYSATAGQALAITFKP